MNHRDRARSVKTWMGFYAWMASAFRDRYKEKNGGRGMMVDRAFAATRDRCVGRVRTIRRTRAVVVKSL